MEFFLKHPLSIHSKIPSTLGQQSILLVDDSMDLLLLHKIILEAEGFRVYTARSGTEALAIVASIEHLALIVLDMKMEDMIGTELLSVLEDKKPKIIERVPVIFLTGMDQIPKSKAIGFIRKPVDMNKFLRAVHGFIEMRPQAPCWH